MDERPTIPQVGDTDLVEVKVTHLPPCDLHNGRTAQYDAVMPGGGWAYMCRACFINCGATLGLGKGQKLVQG